ncbi:2-oxoacid:ferredoxin oxidoreductase subunit beta [Deltaproteobacteria bacterium PRO3]|nr:2-oxoacid:ferredoxin oxidoreductase subunit beta [Deltaproteobacteria bacterium PRO3]
MSSETASPVAPAPVTRKDFISDQDVRWCPGCGDYAILATLQNVLPKLGIPRQNFVFISGIGCSSRFPYYMETYGFHTIHGRAPAVATGLKVYRPELSVWVITGDGDGLSIGGNHLIHALRRNVDLKILLFNNRIYGLTKGQYSPTSEYGKKTKSTPFGSVDYPLNPMSLALGSEATFVARTHDTDVKHMAEIFQAAGEHRGSAFVEIYQNCVIFNDNAFQAIDDKQTRDDTALTLVAGQPLIFGKDRNKGIRLKGLEPEVVDFDPKSPPKDLLVHDPHLENPTYAEFLARMDLPRFPVPMGVFRAIRRPTYDQLVNEQATAAEAKQGRGDLEKLWNSGDTWTVAPEGGGA